MWKQIYIEKRKKIIRMLILKINPILDGVAFVQFKVESMSAMKPKCPHLISQKFL